MGALSLVPNRYDQCSFSVITIQSHIPASTKTNQPLPVFGFHAFCRTPRLWMCREYFYSGPDGFDRTLRGILVTIRQKSV